MNRRNEHNYLKVFADLLQRCVLFATLGTKSKSMETFAAKKFRHNGYPK